jgi:hypothetical protein
VVAEDRQLDENHEPDLDQENHEPDDLNEVGQARRAARIAQIDTSVAHPARVYDYWLGGKDNFAADPVAR